MSEITCFKAYDIRGQVPGQLNEDIVYRIGRAYAEYLSAQKVIIGHDIRLTSPSLSEALTRGLVDSGVDVYDIGLCGTEEVYFATFHNEMDGGIALTASHNPKDYNGMKLVRKDSRPISSDSGLLDIKKLAEKSQFATAARPGSYQALDSRSEYISHLLSYVDVAALKPLKIVCNAGNGGAGMVIDCLEKYLPCEFIKVHHEADGNFPNGVPNPLLPENRQPTIEALLEHKADLAIAWDGDFDRCFFFDEKGRFIEGYYIVGLLAEAFLNKAVGETIIYEPRLIWNTIDIVKQKSGVGVESKTGHGFIKESMRRVNAIYGGEMSAHHYFRDFAYCDSGMIPWLLVAELLSHTDNLFSQLIEGRIKAFPASGEINRKVQDPDVIIEKVRDYYEKDSQSIGTLDGLSVDMGEWRFNIRMSNTEPLLRLNVESRGDETLMEEKTRELLTLID